MTSHRLQWISAVLLIVLAGLTAASAATMPWLDAGNAGLRSDVELLAAYGVIDGPVMAWPIPAHQILRGLANQQRLDAAPPAVQAAAQRVLAELSHFSAADSRDLHPLARFSTTNQPALVRPFGARARDDLDTQVGADYDNDWFSARALVGTQTHYTGAHQRFAPDGSYVGARLGNFQFYGGWVDQWDGPGQDTSLILSNNARPFPKIGVMRADTEAFETPWLRWLGPWRANLFLGLLNDSRIDHNTGFVGLRFDFEPLPGFEVGLARDTLICGTHHPCNPADYFQLTNGPKNPDKTANQVAIDFKYTAHLGQASIAPYIEFMNRDTGPFVHAATSYLPGATLSVPLGADGAYWRLTAEYADSVPTLNWFDFGKKVYGDAYTDFKYVDGFRYRNRTLGFSLDSDSRLFTLTWMLSDASSRRWHLTYYHADISTPQLAAQQAAGSAFTNIVSSQPVTVDIGEAGVDWPLGALDVSALVHGMAGTPVPYSGAHVAGELSLRYGF